MPQQICPIIFGLACEPPSGTASSHFRRGFELIRRGFEPMLSVLHSNLLSGGWGIYCPGCQQTLPKAYWRACQWKADGGKGHHEGGDAWGGISYTKCRNCQPKPIWETDPFGLEEKAPDEEMTWLSAVLATSSPQRCVEFVST